jgi:hypothetical protein
MTKKTEHVDLHEALTQVPVEDATVDRWARSDVLEKAITFHKNNGGMTQPNQVVATATVFLNFITGDNK